MKTDSEGKVCPFCPENGLVKIIDETEVAYLVQVVKNVDGQWIEQLGRYFIIPKQHMESVLERPDDWTVHENTLLWRALDIASRDGLLMQSMGERELIEALNLNWNNGKWAGQLVLHPHLWVIFRYDTLEIGMDGMILDLEGWNQFYSEELAGYATRGPIYHEDPDPQH